MLITIRPDIITKAWENGLPVRAFWLWLYAKFLCKAGGTIPEQALKDALKAIGFSKTSRCDWLNDAVRIGLLTLEVSARTGLVYYRPVSWADGAFIAGCERMGNAIIIELDKFISGSWQHESWAGRLLQLRGRDELVVKIKRDKNTGEGTATVLERKAKPISRNTLAKLTGVSRSTQYRREKKAGVEQVENVLIVQDDVKGFKKYGHDKERPNISVRGGAEVQRLPNIRVIPDRIRLSNSNSRTRKANKRLKALWQCDAIAKGETFPRMYADNFDHAMALHQDGLMYPTGRVITEPGGAVVRVWQRMKQHESK